MTDGITQANKEMRLYREWKDKHYDQIQKNWKDGRAIVEIGTCHIVDKFEPAAEYIIRQRLLDFASEMLGEKVTYMRKGSDMRFTFKIVIEVEKVETSTYGKQRQILFEKGGAPVKRERMQELLRGVTD